MEAIPTPSVEFEFDRQHMDYIRQNFTKRFKFRLAMLKMLPMGYLCGMHIKELNDKRCEVAVKYKWLNKNPFASTFWAVLGMAAEMSSGAMVMLYTYRQKPSIATIITHQTATFVKKAVGTTTFVCEYGPQIEAAVRKTIATGEGVEVICPMTGYNDKGEVVAEFTFTWSMKARLRKS